MVEKTRPELALHTIVGRAVTSKDFQARLLEGIIEAEEFQTIAKDRGGLSEEQLELIMGAMNYTVREGGDMAMFASLIDGYICLPDERSQILSVLRGRK